MTSYLIPAIVGAAAGTVMYLLAGDLGLPVALTLGFSIGIAFAIGRIYERHQSMP